MSKIEWTEKTWNPSTGCNKVSEGCKFCYAESFAKRLQAMGVKGYENGFNFTLHPERLKEPLNIKRPTTFFVNSMSDIFHEEMPFEFLDQIFETFRETKRHIYQLVTKRAQRMYEYLSTIKDLPDNVWVGVTVESKLQFAKRIDFLKKTNAKVKFLSIEPLLDDLGIIDLSGINWVIVGGESGNKARPMEENWAINIKNQCLEQNIPFFFKQWGTWGQDLQKRSKGANGRKLDGKEWNEYPDLIEVPKSKFEVL